MNNYSGSVMVALLPTTSDWCQIDLPHLTLVYCGEIKDLKLSDFNTLAKQASDLACLSNVIRLQVKSVAVFGVEEKVDVLNLQPTVELWAMRRFVESWNASKHTFSPHATIGPVGSTKYPIPTTLFFDRVMVSWGEERITFKLNQKFN